MVNYDRDCLLVRNACVLAQAVSLVAVPARLASGVMEPSLRRGIFAALGGLNSETTAYDALSLVWRMRYGIEAARSSTPLTRALWASSTETLGSLSANGSYYEYRTVFGIPVACQPNYERGWLQSPASDAEILQRARGRSWLFERGDDAYAISMTEDDAPTGAVVDRRTRTLISDIQSVPGCRARLLWGPPRAGKSVAAKQIAQAISGSWARLCGSVCIDPHVWGALDVLRPQALIIDDIDMSVESESPLMLGLERARSWARVIISTANVVPRVDDSDRANILRGAVVGRASDGALIEYRHLSPEVRQALAPDVPDHLDTADLLAQYQVELQRRAVARGVTRADVDELRRLQALVGDR